MDRSPSCYCQNWDCVQRHLRTASGFRVLYMGRQSKLFPNKGIHVRIIYSSYDWTIQWQWLSQSGRNYGIISTTDSFFFKFYVLYNNWIFILQFFVPSTAATAQSWCETQVCPTASAATADNCCVHHVNVHSCPKARSSFCGPWIPHDGQVFTHSEVLVGPVQTGNWTSYIPGFYESGLTSLIAHFKVADMHYALETEINVIPKASEYTWINPNFKLVTEIHQLTHFQQVKRHCKLVNINIIRPWTQTRIWLATNRRLIVLTCTCNVCLGWKNPW